MLPVWWSVLQVGFGGPQLPLSAVWPSSGPVVMVCDLGVLVDLGCWHVEVLDSSSLPDCIGRHRWGLSRSGAPHPPCGNLAHEPALQSPLNPVNEQPVKPLKLDQTRSLLTVSAGPRRLCWSLLSPVLESPTHKWS